MIALEITMAWVLGAMFGGVVAWHLAKARKVVRLSAVKLVDGKPTPDLRRRDRRALQRAKR